ncbi:HisA/HisF-related TIM barrel protein [Patescibacteria group bacterium]
MEIIPGIYILEGQTVALYKGDLQQKEIYKKSPLEYAKYFVDQGAESLFVVDLEANNYEIVKEIRGAVDIPIMCAGKIRTMDQVKQVFEMGMNKVVLGVAAESIYKEAINNYGADKVIVGIKAKGDEVLTEASRPFPLRAIDFAETLPDYGVRYVLFKDMWKESTLVGPNYDEVDRILNMTPLKVYSAGGIGKKKHLDTLKEVGIQGVIIGKALYENELDLGELIANY